MRLLSVSYCLVEQILWPIWQSSWLRGGSVYINHIAVLPLLFLFEMYIR